MKIINLKYKITGFVLPLLLLSSCELNSKLDTYLTDDMLATQRYQMFDMGYKVYSNIPNGFSIIDNNLFAAVTDEAQYYTSYSATQRFNSGNWNTYYNPVDYYAKFYSGIYDANVYLEQSADYVYILGRNRDTLTSAGRDSYHRDMVNVKRLRAEAHVLKAYYYFELFKRYGGVPIFDKVTQNYEQANLPRASVDDVIAKIINEIDSVKGDLVENWAAVSLSTLKGRITRGAALAIKSRALLYAASPQFNNTGSVKKWEDAAAAANEIIDMGIYALNDSYRDLFITDETNTSVETIWSFRMGLTNDLEKKNYPIGTPGGSTGICPSHNLVDAYEYKGTITSDIYKNRDPRFYSTVLKNGDTWNGRKLEIFPGGTDDPSNKNTSPTSYYLKKFLNDNLNLTTNAKQIRSWILFRYGEILLNYAEAMNEAYGPDNNNGYSMTAREAINSLRLRADVVMPPVNVNVGDKVAMRAAIKHERRIELAFEDHRYWDLRRWNDAQSVLNEDIIGVNVSKNGADFTYTPVVVAKRVFVVPKMYLFPFPEVEIVKSKGILVQNTDW